MRQIQLTNIFFAFIFSVVLAIANADPLDNAASHIHQALDHIDDCMKAKTIELAVDMKINNKKAPKYVPKEWYIDCAKKEGIDIPASEVPDNIPWSSVIPEKNTTD